MQLHVTDAYGRAHVLPGPYHHLGEIRHANERIGHHFFDRSTLRFFGSDIHGELYHGRLFVTSEQQPSTEVSPIRAEPEPRRWTVRCAADNGTCTTIGDFQGHETHQDAAHAIRTLVKRARADQQILG